MFIRYKFENPIMTMHVKLVGIKIPFGIGCVNQWNLEPKTPLLLSIWLLTRAGFSGVRPQILKIFACGGSKIPKFSRLRRTHCAAGEIFCCFSVTKEILRYKMSAAGENFAVLECCKGDFTLQNERHRRFFRSQRVTKGILRSKKSAAGENFRGSERY